MAQRQFRHYPTCCLRNLVKHIAFECLVVLNGLHYFVRQEPCALDNRCREEELRIFGKEQQRGVGGFAVAQHAEMLQQFNRGSIFGQGESAFVTCLADELTDFIRVNLIHIGIITHLLIEALLLNDAFIF